MEDVVAIRLYLLRHGPAGRRSAWRGDDADRPLTKAGLREVEQISRTLAAEGLVPDVVLTSPFVRSLQTAAMVAERLDRPDVVTVESSLAPGFGMADLEILLNRWPTAESIMLVGHEPDLSALSGALCGARIVLQKGGLVEIELDRRRATEAVLLRLEQPTHLVRRLGDSRFPAINERKAPLP